MLTDRQLKILQLVIRLYTEHHEPVGSKTLLAQADLPFSSATIRNEMMKLEDMGFLKKTHSSSGRVPSVSGYRFYVEHMLPSLINVEPEEIQRMKEALRVRTREINEIVDMSAKMLSSLTNYTTIVLGPETSKSKLTGFRMVPLTATQIMAILVTDKGFVENQVFNLPQNVSPDDIEKVVGILNEELIGLDLTTVFQRLQVDIPKLIQDNVVLNFDIMAILQSLMLKLQAERLYIAGKNNLIDYYPDNHEQLKSVYEMLDNSSDLYELMKPKHEGVDIKFGSELNKESLKDLSVVTKTYNTDKGQGVIALVGPTNMSYSRVVALMTAMSEELSDSINHYFENV